MVNPAGRCRIRAQLEESVPAVGQSVPRKDGIGKATGAAQYADDIVLFSENPGDLQEKINCLARQLKSTGLEINPDKTTLIEFRKKKSNCAVLPIITLNNKVIEWHQTVTYLGVKFDSHVTPKSAMLDRIRAAQFAFNSH